jgi:hypothetical protein
VMAKAALLQLPDLALKTPAERVPVSAHLAGPLAITPTRLARLKFTLPGRGMTTFMRNVRD